MGNEASPRSLATLHIVGGRKLGGAERFFVRLVNALAGRNAPVAALTVAGSEIDAELVPSVRRFYAPMAGIWDVWSRWRIRSAVAQWRPDVVQTYMGRATRLTHLPAQGDVVHLARLGGYYNLKGYRHAHAWVGNTRGICDYMVREGLPADRVFYIGNFVDPAPAISPHTLNEMRQRWRIPQDAHLLLGLGRLHPNKGFADLIASFALLPAHFEGRPLWLAMVGDGPLRDELHALARRLDVSGRVTWAGWQYEPAPWYQMAEVFICPSRHEPLGNVVLEAWANGVPVVSAAAQGPKELIESGKDGLLVPVGDPQALAEAVLSVLRMGEQERASLMTAGWRKLERDFSEAAIVEAYLALYRRLCA